MILDIFPSEEVLPSVIPGSSPLSEVYEKLFLLPSAYYGAHYVIQNSL